VSLAQVQPRSTGCLAFVVVRPGKQAFMLLLASWTLWLATGAAAGTNVLQLETGQGTALQRVSVPLAIPTNFPAAGLRFEVEFGTDEFIVAGEFVDSFTLTLRTTNRSHTVTLLTVDRFGATWLPGDPGGLLDRERDLFFAPTAAPGTAPFAFQFRYTVLVQIPAPFLTQPSLLVATLFDNEDTDGSRAILSGLQLRPGDSSRLALESSINPAGPYQREASAVFDPIFQTVTMPKAGARRLYRLRGETSSRVTGFQIEDDTVVIDYEKDLGQPVLRVTGANRPSGPFVPVNNAVLDLNARKAFIPLLNAPAFFQIAGTHPARILNDVVSGEQRILDFEVVPIPPQLESSAEVTGPFAEESGVIADGFARRLRAPVGGVTRFYRIVSDIPWILRETSLNGNNIVIKYADP
jgi:hypothetical protein